MNNPYLYVYPLPLGSPTHLPSHLSRSSHGTELSPQCYIAASCWLSVLHMIVFSESHSVMSDSLWPHGLYSPCNSPGQNTGVGSHSLLQGILSSQGSNPGLLHCRWIYTKYYLNTKYFSWYIATYTKICWKSKCF